MMILAESASGAPLLDKYKVPRLRRQIASDFLLEVWGVSYQPQTLAKMACTGGGPPFQKLGRVPLYPTVELDRWAAARLTDIKHSTSE